MNIQVGDKIVAKNGVCGEISRHINQTNVFSVIYADGMSLYIRPDGICPWNDNYSIQTIIERPSEKPQKEVLPHKQYPEQKYYVLAEKILTKLHESITFELCAWQFMDFVRDLKEVMNEPS